MTAKTVLVGFKKLGNPVFFFALYIYVLYLLHSKDNKLQDKYSQVDKLVLIRSGYFIVLDV